MVKSAAILVGINYIRTPEARLRGCENDIINMRRYLGRCNIRYSRAYSDSRSYHHCTKQGIIRNLQQLAIKSNRQKLDLAVFHFSGHGSYVYDRNSDEIDHRDEAIVPVDYKTAGLITDDQLRAIFRRFNPNTKLVIIVDSCHSGTMGDLKYKYLSRDQRVIEHDNSPLKGKVISISGCRDYQTSADAYNIQNRHKYTGAMTSCLLEALQDPNLKNDVFALIEKVREILKRRILIKYLNFVRVMI